ncbi:hypothetical protein BU24DRAFT_465724 [Aaosphaeria arxii CBS 175.79]|uniref:Endoplasmic reticulum-based factor for assembly of V-ATPase n=1 Tax=Aaosphaeria arxii CBS 175.79 TaxID=1450172 RepID=A0A6A5XH17_9PLEO|nr:uncharacterized protein BU24DRAFT_465724 [Aaosphaeria arxii CBS 175.79]KAF2012159.1 hypothetical protein BU24DRAFT_465724 [Aaosphaeria arxii CBS 175.79]
MTPVIVRALEKAAILDADQHSALQRDSEPSLEDPKLGNPISHSQLIDLSKLLKQHSAVLDQESDEDGPLRYRLDSLLKGSKVYFPPPPPKKEPTPEYKALMARLRREEEARAYERMINPPPAVESFSQRFPTSSLGHLDPREAALADDDISYAEVHRQIILIINVLVSIIASSVFIWMAARHWTAPKRLGLSMAGSLLIAVAEVIIYSGYVRRAKEAKEKEKKRPEIKKIIESWVIDGSVEDKTESVSVEQDKTNDGIRYRKGKHR